MDLNVYHHFSAENRKIKPKFFCVQIPFETREVWSGCGCDLLLFVICCFLYDNWRLLVNISLKKIKGLATRLNSFLAALKHNDQVGFVPYQQAPDTTHTWLINLLLLLHQSTSKACFCHWTGIRYSWEYIQCALSTQGFGKFFLSWIKSLLLMSLG